MSEFVVNGYVVEPGEGHNEICHRFVHRYLRAAGAVGANAPDHTTPDQAMAWRGVLFPNGMGAPARLGGALANIPAGYIIGFWTQGNFLQHTMVAAGPDSWVGANNTGCFGTPGGRVFVKDVSARSASGAPPLGWIGNGHQWRGQYQQLEVTFAAPPNP